MVSIEQTLQARLQTYGTLRDDCVCVVEDDVLVWCVASINKYDSLDYLNV